LAPIEDLVVLDDSGLHEVVSRAVRERRPGAVVVNVFPNFADPAGPFVGLKNTAVGGERVEEAMRGRDRIVVCCGQQEEVDEPGNNVRDIEVEVPGREVDEHANGIKCELEQGGDSKLSEAKEQGNSVFDSGKGADLMKEGDFDVTL
jgi:hypothetical protein